MIGSLEKLDDLLVRGERFVVAALLSVMGLVVFLDVVHRVSTRVGSPLANPVVVTIVGGIVAILAFRTRGSSHAVPKGIALGVSLAIAQIAFVKALPNGLVWSQTLALALTLWLGTMGASLAAHARRHLALDIGSKLWPPAIAPKVAAVGHLCTAVFCVGLIFLAGRSLFGFDISGSHVPGHLDIWRDSSGAAGTLSGTGLPKWMAFVSIPYGMTVLAFRFSLEAVRTWTGRVAIGGDDTLHQLGITEEASS
ncbi:MAG: TRAP transporter small permease subunit [Pseudomonadota bacterium]|nr:TRAP transporter small permease subunit [Pseudomonadota bacterium]